MKNFSWRWTWHTGFFDVNLQKSKELGACLKDQVAKLCCLYDLKVIYYY